MADHDILNIWVTVAPFLQGSSCQKGSIVCNVIRCKFYTEEIYVIKAVHISEEADLWPGHYHYFYYKHSVWPQATNSLINSANGYKALERGKKIWFIEVE